MRWQDDNVYAEILAFCLKIKGNTMKSSKIFSAGLLALTALAISMPNGTSHNLSKYTGIPFVIAGACEQGSAKWVNRSGAFVLQLYNNYNGSNANYTGWEIYTSVPSSGTLPSASTSAPAGTYTFTISGLPSGGTVTCFSVDGLGNFYPPGDQQVTVVNGQGSVVAPPAADAGYPVVQVEFFVTVPAGTNPTLFVSNFHVNGQTILPDTTVTDYSSTIDFGPPYFLFCS